MKHFQIIETPYVGPVDLNTLHKTYENLENMHKETVKVTSELKTAIANLELNEAEDEFKNNLVSSIERTIDENSRYGNQAAAYDDIIKLQGDIASSPALIGRLKAQQAFKAYSDKIDSLDMPDDYKEYFVKYIKMFDETLSDDDINNYWNDMISSYHSSYKINDIDILTSTNDGKIQYFKLI